MAGKFEWGEYWYANSWPLSGMTLFIITVLLWLIWRGPSASSSEMR